VFGGAFHSAADTLCEVGGARGRLGVPSGGGYALLSAARGPAEEKHLAVIARADACRVTPPFRDTHACLSA